MPKDAEHFRAVIEKTLRGQGLWRKVHRYEVFEVWYDSFGQEITNRLRPERVYADTLFLVARDSSWAQEFFFMQAEILTTLRERLGNDTIRKIRIRAGALPEQPPKMPVPELRPRRGAPLGFADLVDPGPVRDALRRLELRDEEGGFTSVTTHRR